MSLASSGDDRGHPDAATTHNGAASALRRRQRGGGLSTRGPRRGVRLRAGHPRPVRLPGALGKRDKGVVLRFLVAVTGLSLKQTERLVRQWRETGSIRDRRGGSCGACVPAPVHGGGHPADGRGRRGVRPDVRAATREVLPRQFEVFGEADYARLAAISPPLQRQRAGPGQERQRRPQVVRPRPHPAALRARGQPDGMRSAFAQGTLSPFLNFHRPCLFATEYRDGSGRIASTSPRTP